MAYLSEAEAWKKLEYIWESHTRQDVFGDIYVFTSNCDHAYGLCDTVLDLYESELLELNIYQIMVNKIRKQPIMPGSYYCWPLNKNGQWERINFCSRQFYALVLNMPSLAEPPSCVNFVEIPNAQSLLTLSGQPNTDGASLTQTDFGSIPATYVMLSTVILSSAIQ